MKDLCNGCHGLGCFDCGMQGTVEVPDPGPGLPNVGSPMPSPQLISLRSLYAAGTQTITIESMPIYPDVCNLSPAELIKEHCRVFLLKIIAVHPASSPGGDMIADFELVPC